VITKLKFTEQKEQPYYKQTASINDAEEDTNINQKTPQRSCVNRDDRNDGVTSQETCPACRLQFLDKLLLSSGPSLGRGPTIWSLCSFLRPNTSEGVA